MVAPRYPHIRVRVQSRNPLALISAVRLALRRAGLAREEIRLFSTQAFACESQSERLEVCKSWVEIDKPRCPEVLR